MKAYGIIQGTTDSEHLFALFVDLYESRKNIHETTLEAMTAAVLDLIALVMDITKDKMQATVSYLSLLGHF
jgi:hypothetical protein